MEISTLATREHSLPVFLGTKNRARKQRRVQLIANGNLVEHYEIALYGSLAAFARSLGLQEAVGPLEETLNEEKKADENGMGR